ncbi:glycerophosphodiester phosphodiesterase, partial [Brochothrix thermosphacta]|uniref:glycerophosphodiester phosphodiesterase n=1 Tax=Brochothrix thermosphacta TaxID=2756 RepID=UPI001146D65F
VIETKQSGNKNHLMENELLNVVNGYNLENNIILQSFSLESLNYKNKKDNTIPQMLLLDDKKSENINTIIDTIPTNVKIITLSGNKMNKKTVDVIKKTDRLAMAYTLNTKTQIEKARQLKLDGFFTNETERALENKK